VLATRHELYFIILFKIFLIICSSKNVSLKQSTLKTWPAAADARAGVGYRCDKREYGRPSLLRLVIDEVVSGKTSRPSGICCHLRRGRASGEEHKHKLTD